MSEEVESLLDEPIEIGRNNPENEEILFNFGDHHPDLEQSSEQDDDSDYQDLKPPNRFIGKVRYGRAGSQTEVEEDSFEYSPISTEDDSSIVSALSYKRK